MNNSEMRTILGLDDSTTEWSLTEDALKLFKIEWPTYLQADFSSAKLVRKKAVSYSTGPVEVFDSFHITCKAKYGDTFRTSSCELPQEIKEALSIVPHSKKYPEYACLNLTVEVDDCELYVETTYHSVDEAKQVFEDYVNRVRALIARCPLRLLHQQLPCSCWCLFSLVY